MKRTATVLFFISIFLAAGLGAAIARAQAVSNTCGLATTFCRGGELRSDEISNLLALAQLSGIKAVERIETRHIHPSPHIQIRIKETETQNGDSIRYKTLSVFRKEWVPTAWLPPNGATIMGPFWLDSINQSDLTRIEVDGHLLRVTLLDDITKEIAAPVLSALIQQRWSLRDTNLQPVLAKMKPGLPPSVLSRGKEGKGYKAVFCSGNKSWRVDFEFNNGFLEITNASFAIS